MVVESPVRVYLYLLPSRQRHLVFDGETVSTFFVPNPIIQLESSNQILVLSSIHTIALSLLSFSLPFSLRILMLCPSSAAISTRWF